MTSFSPVASLSSADALERRNALDAFLAKVERRYGGAFLERIRKVLSAHGIHPRSVEELMNFLRFQSDMAFQNYRERVENPYINAEMGEARDLYVAMLHRRYEDADDLYQLAKCVDMSHPLIMRRTVRARA